MVPVQVENPQPKRNYNMKFPAPPPKKKIPQIVELTFFGGVFVIFARKLGAPRVGARFLVRDL